MEKWDDNKLVGGREGIAWPRKKLVPVLPPFRQSLIQINAIILDLTLSNTSVNEIKPQQSSLG